MISAISQRLPTFNLSSEQCTKTIAVALTTLIAFGKKYALFTAGLTLCWEGFLHPGSKNSWFTLHDFSFKDILKNLAKIKIVDIAITVFRIALAALGLISFPIGNDQVMIEQLSLVSPAGFVFFAVFLAPLVEEILFRGFLQERLNDAAFLFDRYIYPISKESQKKISNIFQSVLFGIYHITDGQTLPGTELWVAAGTGWMGYVFGKMKDEKKDLTNPIILHSTANYYESLLIFSRHL